VGEGCTFLAHGRKVVPANFVPASEGSKAAMQIVVPVLAVVLGAMLLAVVVPALMGHGKTESLPLGTERNYGINSGGICPKCKRPFVLHFWGLNLGLSKYDRCPYCGKWSMVRVQSLAKLPEAEKAELEQARTVGQGIGETEEEKLRKELDDSKYQGM
jgi:DNA-directed RNA polymerase subunit RPC12/RpoP